MTSYRGTSRYGPRRLYRRTLSDVPERSIRLTTAILTPCFGAIAAVMTLSPEGPNSPTRRIIVGLIYLSTVPVGIVVGRMHFGKVWRPQRFTRNRPGPIAFVAYADVGLSTVLFTFVAHEAALIGAGLFAIIGVFTAAFTSRSVVVVHVAFTTFVITALAVMTKRQGQYDTAGVIGRWLVLLLGTNATLVMLNAFVRGVQKSFDTQLDNASRDPLTGLLNRRGLELWAEQSLLAHPTRVDFILVDLDHFKAINDTHGHAAGDEVLIRTSNRLEASLGGDGLLARTGGEEFTVLMTNRDSTAVSHAIRAAVHDPRDTIPATASVGVATLNFDDIFGSDPIDPLREGPRRADIALYEAKRAGRNRVRTYPGPPAAPDRAPL
jgi:two-component system, cell cycle response regulator